MSDVICRWPAVGVNEVETKDRLAISVASVSDDDECSVCLQHLPPSEPLELSLHRPTGFAAPL